MNRRAFFNNILETVIFVGNVCGKGPFAFPVVAFIAFAITYLARSFDRVSLGPFLSGLLLIVAYYAFVGMFRLIVYNCHLDPLLAIPGPKVFIVVSVTNVRDTGSKESIKSSATQKYSPRTELFDVVDCSPSKNVGERVR